MNLPSKDLFDNPIIESNKVNFKKRMSVQNEKKLPDKEIQRP